MRSMYTASKSLGRICVRESPSSSCKLIVREWHRTAGVEREQAQRLERNEFPAPQTLLESVAHFIPVRRMDPFLATGSAATSATFVNPHTSLLAHISRQLPTYSVSYYRGFASTAVCAKAEGAEPTRRPRGRPRKDALHSAPQSDAAAGRPKGRPERGTASSTTVDTPKRVEHFDGPPTRRPKAPTRSLFYERADDLLRDDLDESDQESEDESDSDFMKRDWVAALADDFRYCPPGLEVHLFQYRYRHKLLRDVERQREEAREKLREVLEELDEDERRLTVKLADQGFLQAQQRAKLIRLGIIREDPGTGAGEPDSGSCGARWKKGRRPHELSDTAKSLLE
ncbi:hypothetical protein DFH06DRAFT_1214009, partial [Mycena polygramma]